MLAMDATEFVAQRPHRRDVLYRKTPRRFYG